MLIPKIDLFSAFSSLRLVLMKIRKSTKDPQKYKTIKESLLVSTPGLS